MPRLLHHKDVMLLKLNFKLRIFDLLFIERHAMAIASGVCERGADGNHLDNASLDPRDDDTLKRLQVPTTKAGANPDEHGRCKPGRVGWCKPHPMAPFALRSQTLLRLALFFDTARR